ncbi:TPA: hypothetical protein DCX15_00425, partial [bacterium]|nr:hypothetical protein [bacterium]
MRRRILTIFLVIIVILGIGSYLLWQQDLLSKKVKDGIVDLLAERLGLEMTVDRVKGGLLNEIILIDVSLRNPEKIEEEINIQQISLRYNLWKIITQREDISGIQRIEFVRPILLVSRNKEGRWSWQEPIEYLFKGEKRDYLPRILVKDAQIDFLDELTGNRIRFNKVNSSVSEDLSTLKLKDGEISLSKRDKPLRGVSLHLSWSKERLFVGGFSLKPHQIEIFFKGEIPNPEEKRVQFELVTNTFSLKKTKDLFAEREIKDYLGGLDLKGQFRFKGELKYPEEKGLLCNGEMVFTGEGVPSLFARISYQGERLSLSPLTIDDRGSELMGDIDLRDASVDLKLTASRLDIQALSVFVPRKIKWPYLMDGEVKIAGPIKDPLIESRVRFIPDNPKSKIRDIVVVLLRKEGEFRLRSLQIHHQKGTRFSLEGILTKGRTEEFYDVNLDGDLSLPLAEHSLSSRIGFRGEITLFEPSKDHSKVGEAAYDSRRRRKWNLLASRKGMSLEGEEDLLSPYLTGELRLAELCVGGERLGSFTYRIEYQRKGLKISTPSPDSSACLSGRIDFSPLKVNLDVKSNKLALKPLSVWSGLKGIDGQVSGMVTIKAEPGQKPRVEGKGIEIAMPKFLGGSSGT